MVVWINSPRGGDSTSTVAVTVSVGYDLTGQEHFDGVVYQLSCQITTTGGQTAAGGQTKQIPVVAGTKGTKLFSFTMAQAGDYAGDASLVKITTTDGVPTSTPLGDDNQSPIHVANTGGGVVVTGSPAIHRQAQEAAGPADEPVVLKGTFATDPAQPITGVLMEIYHVVPGAGDCPSREVVDYLALPTVLGSTLLDTGGTVRIGTTFSVVFPPNARKMNRQYRLYLLGALGHFGPPLSGPMM